MRIANSIFDGLTTRILLALFATTILTAHAQLRPNLIPQNITLSSYSVRPGDVINVTWTMTNSGTGNAFASFTGVRLGTSPGIPPAPASGFSFTTPEIPAKSAVIQTNSITIPSNLPFGTYYVWVIADEDGFVDQTSRADDNARSQALAVSNVRAQPNLIPKNITLNSLSARVGDQITLSYSITNSGNVLCPASVTGLHLGTSPTAPPTTADRLDLRVPTPEIPANSAISVTHTITIPPGTPLGNYFIWVVVDDVAVSTINQSSRADDTARSSMLTITSTVTRPNLVPQNVVLNATQVRPGDPLTISWTIGNTGTASCPATHTGVHLGTSATTPPTTDSINLRIATPEIVAGGAVNQSTTVTIPAGTALGTYYIWIIADDNPNSGIPQTSEADDAARSPAFSVVTTLTRPNLVPQNVVLSTHEARAGDAIAVSWTIANTGNGNCPASITGLHLGTSSSSPPATDTLNLEFATPAINAGAFVRQTNTITIPPGTAVGTYYIWVIADDVEESTLNQSSRADDAAPSSALAIVTVIRQPNLVPQAVELDRNILRPGDQIGIRWTMTNSGNANCPASITAIRLSQSASIPPTTDPLALLIQTPEIKTNAFVKQTNVVTIPANTPVGTYYLWIIADANNTIAQSSRNDDAEPSPSFSLVTVIPQPNLVPQNITLSSTNVAPGGQLAVGWTMRNSGAGNCPESTTGLYLSQSSLTRPTTGAVKLSLATPAINAAASLLQSNIVTVPANTPPGTYYIWIVADDVVNSTLNQTSRADDALRSVAIIIGQATLISPEFSATVPAPPTFVWSGAANARVYLANKLNPVLGTDPVFVFENPAGTNTLHTSGTNWSAAVTLLGAAPNYFWTVGSATETAVFAEWRAFRTTATSVAAAIVQVGANREFRFQVVAPQQSEVIIQSTESLGTAWTDLTTLPNPTGVVNYTDTSAATRTGRYFRVKP